MLMTREEFGNMLKEYRIKHDISLNKIAKMLGTNTYTILRLEKANNNCGLDYALNYIHKSRYNLILKSNTTYVNIVSVEDFVRFMNNVRESKNVTWYQVNKALNFPAGTMNSIVKGNRKPSIDKVLAFIEYSGHQMELQELSDDESDFIDEKEKEKQETEIPLFIFGHSSIYGGNQRYVTCTDPQFGFIGVVTFYDHMPTRGTGGIILKNKNLYTKFQLVKKIVPEASVKEIKKLMRQCIKEHPVFFQPSQI